MLKLLKISGKDVIKILVKYFDFEILRQRGSHVVLRKFDKGRKIVTVVPLHDELKTGTLSGILELAEIDKVEFIKKVRK